MVVRLIIPSMIYKLAFLTCICFMQFFNLPALLFSGEFKASVSSQQIDPRQGFTLTLLLKDANAQSSPSIEGLYDSFSVSSQQEMSNMFLNNGRISINRSWKYTLMPKSQGEATIPSITINTSEGTLSTEAIVVKVSPESANNPSETTEAVLIAEVSKADPYKNEPVFYTLSMTSKHELLNVNVQPLKVENAIVEPNGEPKIFKKIIDGVRANVVHVSYLISPLKAGPLKIPSITVQGAIPVKRKGGSPFDDNFESFFLMHGFDQLKPFSLSTKEIELEVQPAIADVNPWLPAKSLKVEEIWDSSQVLQVGEPIIRGFKINAEGVMSSQLPSLNDLHHRGDNFKTYADKPEVTENINGGSISSYRKEQFTLIPQQAGEHKLPEISIAWWDTVNNIKAYARIPARTLNISPAFETKSQPGFVESQSTTVPATQIAAIHWDPWLYAILGGLGLLLSAAIFWGIALQRKIARLTENPAEKVANKKKEEKIQKSSKPSKAPAVKASVKDKREKLPDLNPT